MRLAVVEGAEGAQGGVVVAALLEPLRGLLDDPSVTELSINQPGQVWATAFKGRTVHQIAALTPAHLDQLARAIVVYNGKKEQAITSAMLPTGERAQIVLPPACLHGTVSISIRKHSKSTFELEDLEGQGAFASWKDVSFNQPTAAEAEALMERRDFNRLEPFEVELLALKREGRIREFLEKAVLADRNTIISGKTGSGKTVLTRAMMQKVPATQRIITLEDVHELSLPDHPNKVHMLYGSAKGEVTAEAALKSCMRQSPDRIFLAELRGDEAWEYINSLNTGHPGSITTTHANSALMTFGRVASLIKNSPTGGTLDMATILQTLHQTVHVVLYIHARKLVEVFYDPIYAKSKLG